MQELFSREFSGEDQTELFTIYEVEENLFQARSARQIIVLWKVNQKWEGASNQSASLLISAIGTAIDNYLAQSISRKKDR